MPPPVPLHFSHIADRIYDFGQVSDPDKVLLSSYVMSSIRLSMLVCVAANVFCACLVRDQVSETIYTSYMAAIRSCAPACLFR